MSTKIADILLHASTHAPDGTIEILDKVDFSGSQQNQMLFFLKPEVFIVNEDEKLLKLATLLSSLCDAFGISVSGAMVVDGPALERSGSMDRHYGYINQLSRSASTVVDGKMMDAMKSALGIARLPRILGGHEILLSGDFTGDANGLDKLWSSKKSLKLRSGLYFQSYNLGADDVVIVNGFHPAQLEHFTRQDRKILLLVLESDLPWSVLRRRFLGDTFPEKAVPSSFRGHLFQNKAEYGLADVSIGTNCAHLSAGPFEAALEFGNFFSTVTGVDFDPAALRVSRYAAGLDVSAPQLFGACKTNPAAEVWGTKIALFDATEELDTLSAIHLYKKFFGRAGEN